MHFFGLNNACELPSKCMNRDGSIVVRDFEHDVVVMRLLLSVGHLLADL